MSNITINKIFTNNRNTSEKNLNREIENLIKNNLKNKRFTVNNRLTSNNYNKTIKPKQIMSTNKNTHGKKRKRSSNCTPPTDLFVYFKYLTVLRALQIAENENKKEIFNTGNDFVKECIKIAEYGTNNSYRPQRVINRLKPIQTAESGALAVAQGGNGTRSGNGARGGNGTRSGNGARGGNGTRSGNGSPNQMEVGTQSGGGNGGNGSPNQMEVVNKSPSSPDTTFPPFYFENTLFAPLTPPR